MNQENILNLVHALMDDYIYFKRTGDIEAAEECINEISKYLDKAEATDPLI
jgi:hypothetical protein